MIETICFIILFIITLPFWIIFFIIYFIAGIHDLRISKKVSKGDYDKCPYFVEKGEDK